MKKENIKSSKYQRGSEWRKWDLHVHTPESKLGASFVGVQWDDYINALEKTAKEGDIAVIGVTDYMSIDGYEKLYAAYTDKIIPRLQAVDLLLPNIEFRAMPNTLDGKALNIHLLISPSDENHIYEIKRALKNLQIGYTTNGKMKQYGCIREELIEFARAQKPSLESGEAAYKFGIEQFKPSYKEIFAWLRNEGWLLENSLVGVTNGKDGISELPPDGFSSVRDELLTNSHFVFSATPNDRLYYLGKKPGISDDEIKRMYGSLKPCLHGSDAHELDKLFKPDKDRFCWIKSDPTFEGLRQVLWEPESRVHIGATKPQVADFSRIISSLNIKDSNGWFTQSSIPLNPGLVAIIGEKGAGKTAVADLIAFASGVSVDNKSQSSFIHKGRLHLSGMTVELEWGSGEKSKGTLTGSPHQAQRPLVRYLSQDFVERLCSDDHEGNELQEAIEEVVFAHLDEVKKEGFSSFEELRAARESASQATQDTFRGQLASLHREIERIYASLSQRDSKFATKAQTEQQLIELKNQLPSATVAADQEILQSLGAEQEEKTQLEKSIAAKARNKRAVDELLKAYRSLKNRADQDIQELINAVPPTSMVPVATLEKLKPHWDGSVETELSALLMQLDEEILVLQGSEVLAKLDGKTLFDINQRIKVLQESLTKDEVNRKRLIDLQKQISAQEATVQRLEKEIEELDGKTTKFLNQKERERDELYLKYFDALSEDEKGLRELYTPMKEQLSNLDAEMKFELSAGYRVESKEWLEKTARFYDGRKPQAATRKDEIEKFVADKLVPAWKSGDRTQVADAFKQFSGIVSPADFLENVASPSLKMVDLFDWMYSTDHIETAYKINYGGISLEHLSPGTRGIALLVLYLLMDEDDRRPLVIDQPEGNLDNSSVYLQLVPYIRKAKEKRQIVLVTHNPNLVVATDAEQIIVATSERPSTQSFPRITYIAGSLEHNEIGIESVVGTRQAVCTLLEGGDRAFKEREARYSIKR